ncbi:MAG: TIGR02300 family protein [Rhizomicrobium sp.]
MGSMTLVKADLGTKRVCPSCSARFYDLRKRPIECPKCAFAFEPEALYKQRRPRPAEPEKAAQHAEGAEAHESREETATAAAGSELVDEAAEPAEEEEVIDAEEEATESTGMSVVDPAAQGAEMEDIEEGEIAEDDVEDPALLEEVGEEEDDVSGIIDTDLGKDER